MIGAASLRLVDRRGDRTRAALALEDFVQRLDVGAEETLGLKRVALNRDCLAILAHMKSRIHDVVMPAPCAGQNRRMAWPGDARKIDDRSMSEKRATLDECGEIRDRAAIIFELVVKLGVRQAVEQNHIYARGRRRVGVDYLVERAAVLALQIDLCSRTGRVATVDFWKSHHPRDGRRDIYVAAAQLEASRAHCGTAEHQRRAALHDVERAMLPGLDSICICLRTDREIGHARAVEELRDSLVSIRMTQHLRLEVGAIGIAGWVAAALGGVQFFFDCGNDKWILVCDRVDADLFDNLE